MFLNEEIVCAKYNYFMLQTCKAQLFPFKISKIFEYISRFIYLNFDELISFRIVFVSSRSYGQINRGRDVLS